MTEARLHLLCRACAVVLVASAIGALRVTWHYRGDFATDAIRLGTIVLGLAMGWFLFRPEESLPILRTFAARPRSRALLQCLASLGALVPFLLATLSQIVPFALGGAVSIAILLLFVVPGTAIKQPGQETPKPFAHTAAQAEIARIRGVSCGALLRIEGPMIAVMLPGIWAILGGLTPQIPFSVLVLVLSLILSTACGIHYARALLHSGLPLWVVRRRTAHFIACGVISIAMFLSLGA